MLQVGILYSDWSQIWKPLSEIELFRRDGVLTITITRERGNRQALSARMWSFQNNDKANPMGVSWWGEDNYAVGIMPDETFFTTQWSDEDEFLWARSTIDGQPAGTIVRPSRFPTEATVVVFRGDYVNPPTWEKALEIFETEMF